jgi:hypothetical protein
MVLFFLVVSGIMVKSNVGSWNRNLDMMEEDECVAFKTQIKELPLHPNFGSPPKSANEFSKK